MLDFVSGNRCVGLLSWFGCFGFLFAKNSATRVWRTIARSRHVSYFVPRRVLFVIKEEDSHHSDFSDLLLAFDNFRLPRGGDRG